MVQAKIQEKERKEAAKVQRKQRRAEKEKQATEKKEMKERKKEAKQSKAPIRTSERLALLPHRDYAKIVANRASESESEAEEQTCGTCGEDDPPDSEDDDHVDWLACESCQRWYHVVCEFPHHQYGPVICGKC